MFFSNALKKPEKPTPRPRFGAKHPGRRDLSGLNVFSNNGLVGRCLYQKRQAGVGRPVQRARILCPLYPIVKRLSPMASLPITHLLGY